ncbi:hypothetical protein ACJX0J_011046, partial [Zea mays]
MTSSLEDKGVTKVVFLDDDIHWIPNGMFWDLATQLNHISPEIDFKLLTCYKFSLSLSVYFIYYLYMLRSKDSKAYLQIHLLEVFASILSGETMQVFTGNKVSGPSPSTFHCLCFHFTFSAVNCSCEELGVVGILSEVSLSSFASTIIFQICLPRSSFILLPILSACCSSTFLLISFNIWLMSGLVNIENHTLHDIVLFLIFYLLVAILYIHIMRKHIFNLFDDETVVFMDTMSINFLLLYLLEAQFSSEKHTLIGSTQTNVMLNNLTFYDTLHTTCQGFLSFFINLRLSMMQSSLSEIVCSVLIDHADDDHVRTKFYVMEDETTVAAHFMDKNFYI